MASSSAAGAVKSVVNKITSAVLKSNASEAPSDPPSIPDTASIASTREHISGDYKLVEPGDGDHLTEISCSVRLEGPKDCVTKYGPSAPRLKLEVTPFTSRIARIRITDTERARWEIPAELVPIGPDISSDTKNPVTADYQISLDEELGGPGLAIIRKSDNTAVFDTRGIALTYAEQYIEIGTKLPKGTFVYGMGEVTGPFLRETGRRYAFWARDAQTPEHENAYSSMPMFAGMHNGMAFGVYLHNSNALDMIYTEDLMTYKIVGGIVDFFVLLGDTYGEVVKQYQYVTGFPQLPPYWSIGYHQCRWYYDTLEKFDEARQMNMQSEIPVDVFWLDIDYMIEYRLFTLDGERYPGFIDYVDKMHDENHKLVAILDPGVKNNVEGYHPWVRGKDLDIFIKNGNTGLDFVGKVWPGHVVFPDWIHPKIHTYWTEMLRAWMSIMPVDGIWHDMNECSNFVNGDVSEAGGTANVDAILIPEDTETVADLAKAAADGVPVEESDKKRGEAKPEPLVAFDPSSPPGLTNPPYSVNHGGVDWPLNARSISVETTHYGGVLEYNIHNLFGHLNSKTSYNSLVEIKPDERPFILTRSAFAGSGKYASKWLGDNFSHWDSMRWSISGILNMQMFGIPHIGADIGGFNGSPSEELLIRWFQLGAMYPFCRNHNMPNTRPQEAYISESVAEVARRYLNFRYRLLPFWYTAFAKAKNSGGSVVQPVWAVYPPTKQSPEDTAKIFKEGNDAFLINEKLLVLPVVAAKQRQVTAWIPAGVWYNATEEGVFTDWNDSWRTIDAPLNKIPLFFRAGSIIPMHYHKSGKTTVDFRAGGLSLAIFLDFAGKAKGDVYLDDGKTFSSGKSMVKFSARTSEDLKRLTLEISGDFGYLAQHNPAEVTIREITVRAGNGKSKITTTKIYLGYPQTETFEL
ncbi:hypothetical protein TWF730_000974 [Orbilia blumenaviensis]|uniref:alpha-glucosidase n=1 Tax=Orbilia blumenaviensis TaxID=1796055 RepID=A0AAV9VPF5_9PEZI